MSFKSHVLNKKNTTVRQIVLKIIKKQREYFSLIILKVQNKMFFFSFMWANERFIIKKRRRTFPNGRWKSICVFMTLLRDAHAELPEVSIWSKKG